MPEQTTGRDLPPMNDVPGDQSPAGDEFRAGDALPLEDGLRAEILRIAEQRGSGKTLCPSEAARSIGGGTWRDLMPSARRIAFELAGEGLVDVTQHGDRVEPDVRGPIRIRWISAQGRPGV